MKCPHCRAAFEADPGVTRVRCFSCLKEFGREEGIPDDLDFTQPELEIGAFPDDLILRDPTNPEAPAYDPAARAAFAAPGGLLTEETAPEAAAPSPVPPLPAPPAAPARPGRAVIPAEEDSRDIYIGKITAAGRAIPSANPPRPPAPSSEVGFSFDAVPSANAIPSDAPATEDTIGEPTIGEPTIGEPSQAEATIAEPVPPRSSSESAAVLEAGKGAAPVTSNGADGAAIEEAPTNVNPTSPILAKADTEKALELEAPRPPPIRPSFSFSAPAPRRRTMLFPIILGGAAVMIGAGVTWAWYSRPAVLPGRQTPATSPVAIAAATSEASASTAPSTPESTATAPATPAPTATANATATVASPTPRRRPTPTPTRAPRATPTPRPRATAVAAIPSQTPSGKPHLKPTAQDLEFLTTKADNLLQAGKTGDAKDLYDFILKQEPTWANAHYGLGRLYETQKNGKGACDEYRTYLSLAPAGKYAMPAGRKAAQCK